LVMAGKKVLIAYGTRFGSTEEISQEIGKTLKKEGLQVQLVDLKKTKSKEWPSLENFDGVLVGSGIAMGKWMNEPQEFLKKSKEEIQKKKKILGLFVCCGSASFPESYEQGKKDYLEKIMAKIGIEADMCDAFGGVYDFSKTSNLSAMAKGPLKMAAKSMNKNQGTQIDLNERNDFRDWDQIRNFAKKFAVMVNK